MPALASWLDYADATRRILDVKYDGWTAFAKLQAAAEENVLVQLDHLRTHPCIAAAVACHAVRLHAWFYDSETQGLATFAPETGSFVSRSSGRYGFPQRERSPSASR